MLIFKTQLTSIGRPEMLYQVGIIQGKTIKNIQLYDFDLRVTLSNNNENIDLSCFPKSIVLFQKKKDHEGVAIAALENIEDP